MMSRYLKTPQGAVDLADAAAAQPELLHIIEKLSLQLADARTQRQSHAQESGRQRRRADALQSDLDALRDEYEGSTLAEIRADLRTERRRTKRLTKRIDKLVTDRSERVKERGKLLDRIKSFEESNENYRRRLEAMKVELERARRVGPVGGGSALSDLEIATTMLTDLCDRLAGATRRTSSPAAAGALRLAAREVARTRQQLADRHSLAVAS